MTVPACAWVSCPGVVKSVTFDLEWTTRATELVPHLLEESLEGRLLDGDQSAPYLVPCVMVATETGSVR